MCNSYVKKRIDTLKKLGLSPIGGIAKFSKDVQKFKVVKCGCEEEFARFENITTQVKRNNGEYLCMKCNPKRTKTTNYTIQKIKKLVEENKDYVFISAKDFKSTRYSKIKIFHTVCGEPFDITVSNLKQGKGCPSCAAGIQESKAAKYFKKLIIENNIEIIEEYSEFKNPFTGKFLPVDFYIPSLDCFIEIDGIQHYKPVDLFGGVEAFEASLFRDYLKENAIKAKGSELIRVPMIDFEKGKSLSFKNQKKIIENLIDSLKERFYCLYKNNHINETVNTYSRKTT